MIYIYLPETRANRIDKTPQRRQPFSSPLARLSKPTGVPLQMHISKAQHEMILMSEQTVQYTCTVHLKLNLCFVFIFYSICVVETKERW